MDLLIEVLKEGVTGSLKNVYTIAIIVIPLMIVLELAKDLNILDNINKVFYPVTRIFKISSDASFTLFIGIVFGISFGAGLIIQYAKEGRLTSRELILVNSFLAVAHALIEDTLLFVLVGASATMLVGSRLVLAILITLALSRLIPEESGVDYLLTPSKRSQAV
ncbi:MAG: nucleoside recognition protein [Bacillota bacterium]|nr:nucleoside recognition protein [Bacillota bacterium]